MKTAAWIVLALIVVAGFLFISRGSSLFGGDDVDKSSSPVVADKATHDFGNVDIFGGKVETGFTLTNEGTDDVVILAGTTSCGCTEGSIDGVRFGMHEPMSGTVTIKAGESKNVTAIYDPLAHGPDATGPVTRQLFLKTNSEVTPEIELRVSANVVKTTSSE